MAYTQVVALTSFSSGTTIVSADVNANFTAIRSVVNALVTGTDTIQAARINPVSGAGVGINAAALDYVLALVAGNFTSGGGASSVSGLGVAPGLTAAAGDTAVYAANVVPTITTQGASETVNVVASMRVYEPQITVGSGDTVTVAATVYVENAPTEGTTNAALYVAAGASMFGGAVRPTSNDAAALGASGVGWSDLFLASGAVINFAAGNVTLTHSSGVLSLGQSMRIAGLLALQAVAAGVLASTTQTQGQGPLTNMFNQVSTVANTNDTVTLPANTTGDICVIRNDGANTLQIFPQSGGAINGLGTDNPTTLAAGSQLRFWATSATQWYTW